MQRKNKRRANDIDAETPPQIPKHHKSKVLAAIEAEAATEAATTDAATEAAMAVTTPVMDVKEAPAHAATCPVGCCLLSVKKMSEYALPESYNGPMTGLGTLYLEHRCDLPENFKYALVLTKPADTRARIKLFASTYMIRDSNDQTDQFECHEINGDRLVYRIPTSLRRPSGLPGVSRTAVYSVTARCYDCQYTGVETYLVSFSAHFTQRQRVMEKIGPQYTAAICDTMRPLLLHSQSLLSIILHYLFDADTMQHW